MKHTKKLTILHSNDLHGDFLAEETDQKLVGGVSMLSGYINKVRSEEKNVIYAIAGDMFRGSVIDAEYKGVSTIEIMNMLSPDIVSIGNHEIDYGVAHLLLIEKCAKFPIINANLFIKTNGARLFTPYKILQIDGMNILFIGIITEEILNQAKREDLIGSIIDTKDAAKEVGRICNAHNSVDIDFTVLLTHIGFEFDKKLANLLDPAWGVDVIIGGHSHTFLEKAAEENGVVIVQAGTGTDIVGRFDIVVDTDNNCIDSYTWSSIPIDDSHCPNDPQIESIINKYKSVTDRKYDRVVTRFSRELTHPERNRETELGNLLADAFQESLGVDIMLLGSGSIRKTAMGPIVDFGDLNETFPYDDEVYMFKVTGAQFRNMMKYMLRDDAFLGITEFYQVSNGVKMQYSKERKEFDHLTYKGKEIADDDIFSVGMQTFHYNNIGDFLGISQEESESIQKSRVLTTSCIDVVDEYLNEHNLCDRTIEGRISVID